MDVASLSTDLPVSQNQLFCGMRGVVVRSGCCKVVWDSGRIGTQGM